MQRMPSLLESRHHLLHLRASLERESIQPDGHWIFSQSRTMSLRRGDFMAIVMGRLKNKDITILHIIWEREMHQKGVWRNSRSFPKRFHTSWISNQYWSNWRSLHPNGQGGAERFHLSNDGRWVLSVQKELVDLSQWVWKKRTDEKSFWVQRSVDQRTPSSPRVWRRTTRTDSFLAIPAMASIVFFIQHILVAVERFLVEVMTINKKVRNWAHVKSSMKEPEDPLCRFFTQTSDESTFKIFWFVAVRSFTGDSSLLQPTVCVNTTPHTSHFLTELHAHAWLKSCVCHARIMCHPHVFVLALFDHSTFLSLHTIFSLIILSFLLSISFIFHDVVDKFPVHSR